MTLIYLLNSDLKKIFKRDKSGVVDKKMNSNAETELAPLRSLDDFILSQSRLNLMHILSEFKGPTLVPGSRSRNTKILTNSEIELSAI